MSYTDKELKDATQIAYLDLNKAYEALEDDKKQPPYTINDLIEKMKKEDIDSEVVKYYNTSQVAKEVLNWKITYIHDSNAENGFYSCIIETSDNEAIVAFRGSESNDNQFMKDWMYTNFQLLNNHTSDQQREIMVYLKKIKEEGYLDKYDHVASTGHSLGGNLSDYFTIRSVDYGLDKKIKQSVNFDGPGFSNEFIKCYAEQITKVADKMKHYQWSAVGSLLFPIPGVPIETIQIYDYEDSGVNVMAKYPKILYDLICRHDTRSVKLNEDGSVIPGNMDSVSIFADKFSKIAETANPNVLNAYLNLSLILFNNMNEIDDIKADGITMEEIGELAKLYGVTGFEVLKGVNGLNILIWTLLIESIKYYANEMSLENLAMVIVFALASYLSTRGILYTIANLSVAVALVVKLIEATLSAIKNAFKEFKKFIDKAIKAVVDFVKSVFNFFKDIISSKDSGVPTTDKIRDYSYAMLEVINSCIYEITSEEFFDMYSWDRTYGYEDWYGKINIDSEQRSEKRILTGVMEEVFDYKAKVKNIFEDIHELDDSYGKEIKKRADDILGIAASLV